MQKPDSDYARIARAIRFINARAMQQPGLEEVANELGLSAEHCQRLFKRWAGISPKRFLQYLTLEHAKHILQQSGSVFDAVYASGLSGSSRLHDHFIQLEAMTPGQYLQSYKPGRNNRETPLTIRHGIYSSPFGEVWLAATDKGICHLEFISDNPALGVTPVETLIADNLQQWPYADRVRDDKSLSPAVETIFSRQPISSPLLLHVKGSNFQIQVWKALLKIPPGAVCSYHKLATAIGKPSASRAVANAVGANPVSFLIPCHRVIRSTGALGGYHWGLERKQAMLAWEFAGT